MDAREAKAAQEGWHCYDKGSQTGSRVSGTSWSMISCIQMTILCHKIGTIENLKWSWMRCLSLVQWNHVVYSVTPDVIKSFLNRIKLKTSVLVPSMDSFHQTRSSLIRKKLVNSKSYLHLIMKGYNVNAEHMGNTHWTNQFFREVTITQWRIVCWHHKAIVIWRSSQHWLLA